METATKTKWNVDTTHSEIQFKVKHLVISTVTGAFKKFNGSATTDNDDFDGANVEFTIDVNSIDTNQADRDNHLKSPDFFAAEQFPEIKFKGVVKKVSGSDYKVVGQLTIRETTKEVTFDADFGGIAKDPWGNVRAGFEITGKVNRKEFGLNWSAVTEAGGVVVGDDVKLHINVEVVKS